MKKTQRIFILVIILFLSACSTVKVKENLVVLNPDYFPETKKAKLLDRAERFPNLVSAYQQIHGVTIKKTFLRKEKPLPSFMIGEPLVTKIVDLAYNSLVKAEETSIEITKKDIGSFVAMNKNHYGASISDEEEKAQVHEIIKQYLIVYYSDSENGFIDREGTTYKRPEIKNSIGNDIITAAVAIFLEGLFDAILDVPVYKGPDGKFQTVKGAEPTAHKLKFASGIIIVDVGKEGIDRYELKAIRYLSGLAADQSKTLSGLVLRAFGDLEIGFVIGGHFSVGDNDTLAKILDTIFEVSSKRIVEAGSYKGFEKISWEMKSAASVDHSPAIVMLLKDIEKIQNAGVK